MLNVRFFNLLPEITEKECDGTEGGEVDEEGRGEGEDEGREEEEDDDDDDAVSD